jgi:hypothetical protein
MRKAVIAWTLAIGAAAQLPADFSYRETVTISGDAAAGMAGRPGQPAEPGPMVCTVAVKDGRLLARMADRAALIDFARQTLTEVDYARRSYSVASFDELSRARPEDARAAKPLVTASGVRRAIAGLDASGFMLTMPPHGAETGPISRDLWMAPAAAGYAEMREALARAAALDWSPWESAFRARPEVVEILAALFRARVALDGMAVAETTVIALPPRSVEAARNPFQVVNPMAPAGGGSGPLYEIRAEMSGFSAEALEEADFSAPAGFRRVGSALLQPAKK